MVDDRILFPSPRWAEKYCEELNRSQQYRSSGRGWVWPILFVATDLPEDLKSIYPSDRPGFILELENGECKGYRFYEDSSQASAPFVISAKYSDWVDIILGKQNPVIALMKGKLKLAKGQMSLIVRYASAAIEMVKTAQKVGGVG